MLASLRLDRVRSALVTLLVILSALVAVARAQTVVDGVQHALGVEHAAPLGLAADHVHAHDEAPEASPSASEQDHAPGPHHHHSEGTHIAALTAAFTLEVAISRSEADFRSADAGSPRSRIFGLERPPKALEDLA